MGLYNTYGNKEVQIKVGDLRLKQYDLGDEVYIPDGVYVGHEGIVVVIDGIFAAEFDSLTSKWNDPISPDTVLRNGVW